jgi:hypothetical protein
MTKDDDDQPPTFYANVMALTLGPFDLILDFGFKRPEQQGTDQFDKVARIAVSLSHAKTMVPLLQRIVTEYEKNVGAIAVPDSMPVITDEDEKEVAE